MGKQPMSEYAMVIFHGERGGGSSAEFAPFVVDMVPARIASMEDARGGRARTRG
jgi:hypothetical protein